MGSHEVSTDPDCVRDDAFLQLGSESLKVHSHHIHPEGVCLPCQLADTSTVRQQATSSALI